MEKKQKKNISNMIPKQKLSHSNKLLQIREELKLTQKEMGELLGVKERMISNYESGYTTLPLDKALLLSRKYNYSLEWIYDIPCTSNNPFNNYRKYEESQNTNFFVDIRKILYSSNDHIYFAIPDTFWMYCNELEKIESLAITDNEKERKKKELYAAYSPQSSQDKYWTLKISKDDFLPYLFQNTEFIPFAEPEPSSSSEPSELEKTALKNFFSKILNGDKNSLSFTDC